jgi:NAD(P)-dependent dehydrogenase (short-subunit alcohol dehydrogenase family)
LSKRQDIRRVVDISLETFGRIDCVINTAADTRFHGKLIELWESNDYPESQLRINCIAPLTLVSAVFQECWKNNTSENMLFNRNVVNVSSISGFYAYPSSGQGFYSASKAAMNMLTLYLSLELAPYSVRANAICPARFTHGSTIQAVVKSIEDLLVGNYMGKIVSEFLPMEK